MFPGVPTGTHLAFAIIGTKALINTGPFWPDAKASRQPQNPQLKPSGLFSKVSLPPSRETRTMAVPPLVCVTTSFGCHAECPWACGPPLEMKVAVILIASLVILSEAKNPQFVPSG